MLPATASVTAAPMLIRALYALLLAAPVSLPVGPGIATLVLLPLPLAPSLPAPVAVVRLASHPVPIFSSKTAASPPSPPSFSPILRTPLRLLSLNQRAAVGAFVAQNCTV
ncbi:hypothetical protein IWX50DRAFT_625912 [Phyllosticta citricarpa]